MYRPDFIEAISADVVEPLYLLESIELGSFNPTSAPLRLSSFHAPGYLNCLTREGSAITYGRLTPGTWERTSGTLTLGIGAGVELRKVAARGQAVRFLVGFPGWDPSRFQAVWLGIVRNLRWESTGGWVLECLEMPGALQNRFDDQSDQQNLFWNLPYQTTLAADFDPSIELSFTVDDAGTARFQRDNHNLYCARIYPSGGNEYYVTASALAADVFTLDTAGAFDSPLNNHNPPGIGTPDVASTDDTVEAIAWVRVHPIDFGLRVLASKGDGSNGPDDLLPASWAYGLDHAYIARTDALAFKALTTPTPFEHWDFLVDHSQSDGVSFMAEQLRPGGFFVSQHQGKLTVRAVVTYTGQQTPGSVSIDDDDLVSIEYETWASEAPVEYRQLRVLGYNGADPTAFQETNLSTRPTRTSRRRDLVQAFSDVSAGWTDEVANRLGPYDTRVSEALTVKTAGWKAAVASLGDIVFLTTGYLQSRTGPLDGAPESLFNGTACLMIGGGPDWFGSTCTLELLHVPEYGALT